MTNNLIRQIQVNIPFTMLCDTYLDTFVENRINPEIGIDAKALERFSLSDFQSIAAKLRAYSPTVTLHGPFIDLAPGAVDPFIRKATRQRFEQLLQLVDIFNPRAVVCHAGYQRNRHAFYRDTWVENSLDMWSWLAQSIRAHGAILTLENVYEDGPEDIQILFECLEPQQVGFCLDTGHLSAFGKDTLENWLAVLEPYLAQLHLHDNDGGWDDHLALGRGKISFQYLFDFLRARRSTPPIITLEPHTEDSLQPSLAYLRRIWPW
jgi:sugar phosphate isomerase/epimerase